MKRIKQILPIIIAFIIGISTTVGAVTVFNSKDITYSSSVTSKKNVKEALDELYTKANTPWTCASGWYCYKQACPDGNLCRDSLVKNVQLGDYISMTPTSTSYTISKDLTGYTSDQTINPSELKLWRVIRKNNDGTVDVVSEYVSNTSVYFKGRIGYMKFVGTLNTIATQYTNSKYVQKTRHMGYSNQLQNCSTLSLTECPGDDGYSIDTVLVQSIMGLVGFRQSGEKEDYFLASRFYKEPAGNFIYNPSFRVVNSNGEIDTTTAVTPNGSDSYPVPRKLRPILTLKKDIRILSGDGKSASTAYQLT